MKHSSVRYPYVLIFTVKEKLLFFLPGTRAPLDSVHHPAHPIVTPLLLLLLLLIDRVRCLMASRAHAA